MTTWKRGWTIKCPITYFELHKMYPNSPKSMTYVIVTLPGRKLYILDCDRVRHIGLGESRDQLIIRESGADLVVSQL